MKARFKTLDQNQDNNQNSKNKKTQLYFFYYVAAAVIIIFLLLWYVLPISKNSNPNRIVEDTTQGNSPQNNYSENPQYEQNSDSLKQEDNITDNTPPHQPTPEQNKQSLEPEVPKLFKRNPDLDALIAMNTRTGDEFKVISPVEKDTLSLQIVFNWENNTNAKIVYILVDQTNKSIFQESIPQDQNEFILNSSQLEPGLYYWKILSARNQLLHIASFYWIP